MVMTIRNTCRLFDNLFQFIRNREMKPLNSPNISVSGFEPVSVVYIAPVQGAILTYSPRQGWGMGGGGGDDEGG